MCSSDLFSNFVTADGKSFHSSFHILFSVAPVSLALIGIFVAYVLYQKENNKSGNIANSISSIYKVAYNKFYIDELYLFITKKIIFNLKNLKYLNSKSIWYIADVFSNLEDKQGKMQICECDTGVKDVLELVGITTIISTVTTEAEAITAINA